jgi:DUF4097 and DUF4098 domain-containing protein YvlB
MRNPRALPTWAALVVAVLCTPGLSSPARAGDKAGRLTEEFHQTYPLPADGRVGLENINGAVHISVWDRNEVKVDAIKSANTQERLDEARIVVDAKANTISIRTEYPPDDRTFHRWGADYPASVEYTLTVPRTASLDEIKLINGALDINGSAGEVQASCINGQLTARGLTGRTELSTINGRLDAQLDRLSGSRIELSSVNGSLSLTLPSDAKAELEASTVHGGINNEFGLHVARHSWLGHNLRAQLGGGGTPIRLSNVNGVIEVRHANDGRPLSPAKNLGDRSDDDDTI